MSLSKLAKCLGDLVDDGHLSHQDAEEAMADARRRARKLGETRALSAAEAEAALAAVKEKAAIAQRNEYLTALQAKKMVEVEDGMRSHPEGLVHGAQAFLTKDWTGKAGHTNVEYRASAIMSVLDRSALDLFERYAPKLAGWKEQTAGLRLVLRELFGEDTGDTGAKAAAKAWGEVSEKARRWFNDAGGDIGKLENWHLPQSHAMERIRQAGEEAWVRFVDDHGVQVMGRNGEMLTGLERRTALKAVYETVSTGGLNKVAPGAGGAGKKLANQRAESRVLHFPDADAWLAYHQEFGNGSLFGTFAGHLSGMAKDIAALEILGPNPAAMVRAMGDIAERGEPGSRRSIEKTWAALQGSSEVATGWRKYLYAGMQSTRNLLRAAQMGSAVIPAAMGDLAQTKMAAAFNGLETTGVLSRYLGQLNPADAGDRAFARRHGLVAEATLKALGNSRVVDDDMAKGFTARLANTTFELSGMNAHTHGLRAAFGMEAMATLAEQSGKRLADLDGPLRAMLERGGITEAKWDVLRKGPMAEYKGSRFMDPLELAASGNRHEREAGLDLAALIKQETDYAVPEPDARVRGMASLGTKGNTLAGELWRTVSMYRSFPVTVTLYSAYRALHAHGQGGWTNTKVGYGLGLLGISTATAALAIQMKQVVAGRDPRDMKDWKFWAGAVAAADGVGILGDFFHAALSRTDKDLTATLAGTGYGLVSDVLNLTTRNAMAEAEGKPSNTVGDAIAFLGRYQPGSNIWWARAGIQHLFWQRLQLMADPAAPRAFARMEARAAKDYHQSFWWRPGEALPARAPNLTAAFGESAR